MSATAANAVIKEPFWRKPAVLDRLEQVVIVLLWCWLVQRVDLSDNIFAPLVLLSEGMIAFFTLIRRSTTKLSMRLGDWLLAMTGTCAGLLIMPGIIVNNSLIPLGLVFYAIGNIVQLWAKFTLGRSFGVAPANRGIKIAGPYRYVRHPMYIGYGVVHISVLMLMFHPLNILLYVIGWWAQILRILAEERVLAQDPEYAEYMTKVKWRLIPGVF